jgi:signal transduction histidine kinase
MIVDSGVGIPGKMLDQLGKAFIQGDNEIRRSGGTGLGLAISRALIELMGGTFAMSSEGEGRGTTVTVRLPLVRYSGSARKERLSDSAIASQRR